jgi:hypothetical protein
VNGLKDIEREIRELMDFFNVKEEVVEGVRERLNILRELSKEIDELIYV